MLAYMNYLHKYVTLQDQFVLLETLPIISAGYFMFKVPAAEVKLLAYMKYLHKYVTLQGQFVLLETQWMY